MKILKQFRLYFVFLILPFIIRAQTWDIKSDYWSATDALGRKTPTESEVGNVKNDKYVGIFYWTWHSDNNADFSPVMNVSQIIKAFPNAATTLNDPAWKGFFNGGVFWWDEPLFGYYRTTDDWVLRKHAQMLANAGIDVVFFDCTNGNITWKSSYKELLKVWEQARIDGVKAPQVVFILNFGPTKESKEEIVELYKDLYKPGLYKDLWFLWEGKPLIMAYPEMLNIENKNAGLTFPGSDSVLMKEIKNFFTFRPGQPDYVTGPSRNDQWGWLENYPQHGYGKKNDGKFEQVTVGVSQNACDATNGHCCAFNQPTSYGRSYTKANGQSTSSDSYFYGLNFQEQWNRAFEINPDLVFVTGWNEWVAGRWDTKSWPNPYAPFSFVDEYNSEKSRDIEPVKSWGDKGDAYYIQLVNNVRKFKGMQSQESISTPKTIEIGKFDDWLDVKPEFLDYKGDTMWRNAKGQGDSIVYINNTGRNDIVLAKVARDSDYVYFYVETADNLTSQTDPKWMRLFIDIDRDKTTGWQGYDYVINRVSPGNSAVIEKSKHNSWDWEKIGEVEFAVKGKVLEMKVKRSILNVKNKSLNFEFKWSDNMQEDGNIMDFYVNGDAAPDGRFNYVYSELDNNYK
jgi:hypothetical protein